MRKNASTSSARGIHVSRLLAPLILIAGACGSPSAGGSWAGGSTGGGGRGGAGGGAGTAGGGGGRGGGSGAGAGGSAGTGGSAATSCPVSAAGEIVASLAGTWTFTPTGAAATTIDVPGGGWVAQGFRVSSARYERMVTIPDLGRPQATYVEFGAVNHQAALSV